MKITVLAGGLSPERDVSLSSGAKIAAALVRRGHRVALADVYMGLPKPSGDLDALFVSVEPPTPPISSKEPDLDAVKASNGGREALIGENILELCAASDVVFLALHGGMGENGQLQATLDNFAIKYTGSGYIGCLLAMDKDLSKKLMSSAGIRVPDGITAPSRELTAERILTEVGLPCVVKPCSCGSSVGVSIVETVSELDAALDSARAFEDRIIVEKRVVGREFSVGVLGDRALPAIEIIPKAGFYDYKNKYQSNMTVEVCPAELTPEQADAAGKMAVDVFHALGQRGYARIDMILDESTGTFCCLEANSLPGMTPTSLLPQEAAAAGIDYDELCEIIVKYPLRGCEISPSAK